MTDFFIKAIPLPIPRPSGLFSEYEPFTSPGMPLGSTEKAADAFNEVVRYPPSLEHAKPLSELLIESSGKLTILMVLVTVAYVVYRFNRWKRTGL